MLRDGCREKRRRETGRWQRRWKRVADVEVAVRVTRLMRRRIGRAVWLCGVASS